MFSLRNYLVVLMATVAVTTPFAALAMPTPGDLPSSIDSIEMAVGRSALDIMEKRWSETVTERDVINPKILLPTSKTIWTPGAEVAIRWNTSVITSNPRYHDYKGTLLLGNRNADSPSGQYIDVSNPLADGFLLRDGVKYLNVPRFIRPDTDYFVVLMGDSGNASPLFTVRDAPKKGSTTSPPPSAEDNNEDSETDSTAAMTPDEGQRMVVSTAAGEEHKAGTDDVKTNN